MQYIQNSFIGSLTYFNKTMAGLTFVSSLTLLVLSIIGLSKINSLSLFNRVAKGISVGSSLFIFAFAFAWIAALYKNSHVHPLPLAPAVPIPLPLVPVAPVPLPLAPAVPASEPLEVPLAPGAVINKEDAYSSQPLTLLIHQLGFLSPSELARWSRASKTVYRAAVTPLLWNAFNVDKLFPLLSVVNASDWEALPQWSTLGLKVTDAPTPVNRLLIPALTRGCSLPIEENKGITDLLIPEGLTINKLAQIMPLRIWHGVHEIRDIKIDKTYRVIITNDILVGSRKQSVNNQKNLLVDHGCTMQQAVEVLALIIVTFLKSKECLYHHNGPWGFTYTRCEEQVDDMQVVVGGSPPEDGVIVSICFHADSGHSDLDNRDGVGAVVRRFVSY